ncbi:hypothetical protein MTBPR1_80135 [Candidatus Terasakiella magnetica]|uniref:Uncharacterized protein n=1 Tax=Candidatus Terasakiella magnetica TaxID=1867952 RepID=A0A1C3RLF5_9PROT|nr:hypothetical protein MTBPR1_80135 [Candidatus Terasakiella magnetica]
MLKELPMIFDVGAALFLFLNPETKELGTCPSSICALESISSS